MRGWLFGIALAVSVGIAGASLAVSPRNSAGDFFVAAVLNTPHDTVLAQGSARGRAGQPFMLANNGTGTAFVVACEDRCTSVRAELRAAGLPPLAAVNSSDNPHVAVLRVPRQYQLSLSNFEVRITLGCARTEGCYYNWALLGAGLAPTPSQRGIMTAPTEAEWNAAARPAGALQWLSRPNGDDLRFFYPLSWRTTERAGSAHLQCIIRADGALRCRVHDEAPPRAGFGESARRLSTLLRVGPTDASGQPTANRRVEIPVQFAPVR